MNSAKEQATIEKIKKLLALAGNNPNENERARAMEMAEKLMAEHNLEMSKLFLGENDKAAIGNFVTDIPGDDWHRHIGRAVCELYFCKLYLDQQLSGKYNCAFIGTEINRQVAYEMALWLIATIKKEAKDTFEYKIDQEDFCSGAGQVIEQRAKELIEQKRREAANAPSDGKANQLMVIRKDLQNENDQWAIKNLNLGRGRALSTRHNEAASAGQAFGKSVNLSRQVGAKAAPKRIGQG